MPSADNTKLFITVGSGSNIGEKGMDIEKDRATIWELDLASGKSRVFAAGLRNANGMAIEPTTGALWTSVNERDEIGDDVPPDYLTSVQDGGFYGWPYSYWGKIVDDPRAAAAAGSGREIDHAGLRAGRTHSRARPDLVWRRRAASAVPQRHVRRTARLVESLRPQRLPGDVRAVPGMAVRPAIRSTFSPAS